MDKGGCQNVQVAVRIRPSAGEMQTSSTGCISAVDGNQVVVRYPDTTDSTSFVFDYVYDQDSTQQAVFEDLGTTVVQNAFEGEG